MSLLTIKDLMKNTFPLTKQQLGLWIEQCLHPSNTSYNTCVKVKLKGALDIQRFLDATPMVIDYFDTLKVYFTEQQGIPFQCVDKEGIYQPEFIDISEGKLNETDVINRQAKDILSQKLNTPIDLKKFPITRACLIKVASDVFYFIGMVPHIVSDGRSAILYLESLSIAYNQGQQGLVKKYQSSKRSWQDYIDDNLAKVDQEKWLADQQHWQQRLAGATPAAKLPLMVSN
ncbi:MAG: condensation domain-containing protein [Enterobacterales bacterium]|nr:condensation domain-containing protein [Enterobacterales bacterium]